MAKAGRGQNGKFRRNPATAEQDARACDLFGRGYTFREISAELGWSDPSSAKKAVERAYKAVVAPTVEMARQRSLDRLNTAHRVARSIMERDHTMVSHGRVVKDEAGLVLLDDGPKLAAIDRIVKIEQRIAAVVGVDAPAKSSVEFVSKDAFAEAMEEMTAELEDRERAGQANTDVDEDTADVES